MFSSPSAPLSGCLLLVVIIGLFVALSLTESHQQSASDFPTFMFLLPMSSLELVFWPMALSAFLMALSGAAISLLVLRAVAPLSDTWWLVPYLAGNVSVFQATAWYPLKRPELRTLLAFIILTNFVAGPIAFGTGTLRPLHIGLIYATLVPVSILCSVRGVGRARCGLASAGSFDDAYRIPDLSPFRSRVETQVWFEEKRNGLIMKVLTALFLCLFGIIALGTVPFGVGISEVGGVQISRLALLWAFLAIAVLPYFGFGGCCASEQDNVAKDRSLVAVLALRPLTSIQIVQAKALMTIRLAFRLAVPTLVAALVILLLPTSLNEPYRPTIVQLAHILSVPQALGLVVACGLIQLGGVKAAVSSIWISLGRLPQWLMFLLSIGPLLGVMSAFAWLMAHEDQLPRLIPFLPVVSYTLAATKMAVLVPVAKRLLRSRLVPISFLRSWVAGCCVAAVILFGLACWAIPPSALNRWAIAAQVFLALPLVRVALAPMFVDRGRHA